MRESLERNDCGRAAQLLGYLYGESAAAERADFECHLRDCAACRDELAAFAHVRNSVADFHAELLQTAPALTLEEFASEAGTKHTTVNAPHGPLASPRADSGPRVPVGFASPDAAPRASARAAWAALREFFRLSPAWLRASTAAAALALCALALMAVFNAEVSFGEGRYAFRTGMRPAAAQTANAPAPPQEAAQTEELAALRTQLESLAAERDAAVRELEETREQLDDSRASDLVAAEFESAPAGRRGPAASRYERGQRRAASAPSKSATPSRSTRRDAGEEDLPRLLDLLGDAN